MPDETIYPADQVPGGRRRPPGHSPVRVTLDVTLPRARFGPHRVSLEDRSGRFLSTAEVQVEMVDGKPEFIRLDIGSGDVGDASSPTVSIDALASVDWHKAGWDAVLAEAMFDVSAYEKGLTLEEHLRRLQSVDEAAKESRRYNRLTPDELAEVLELWQAGGSQSVAARFCVSRRQADRYVKKAREKAGLL